jgi:hypothetical protein
LTAIVGLRARGSARRSAVVSRRARSALLSGHGRTGSSVRSTTR